VVKAIASSKKGYRKITNQLTEQPPSNLKNPDDCLISTIKKINHLTDNIIELIIHSPLAVQNFKPGQFFRLQNYTSSPEEMLEPLALTGAYVEGNNISLIVLKSGLSSKLCWNFKEGERVALMGPAGTPTTIFKNKNVMLIGGGLGNVTLLSISKALKNNGCRVVYIAGYKNLKDRFYPEKIETYADRVIWCCEKDVLPIHRAKDLSIKGTVIDGIKAFNDEIKIDEIICAGSSGMMAAVAESKYLFKGRVNITCSVNSLMQCMQGVCGQCLQKTTDGKHIFSCIAQDQDSGLIDFKNLQDRQKQNSLQQDLCIYSANLNN
jgi:NAD(P)H-flavin reductase